MASGKGADSIKSTNFGLLWGSLHFGGPRSRKSSKSAGALEMASGKRADSTKSTNFGLLWGSLHFGDNPEIHRGLRNGFRTRNGLYKIDKFWAFVVFPPFRRSQKPESQEIHRGLGNGFRKRSGLYGVYKINKFWAFVGFPSFRRSHKPEVCEINNLVAFVRFPSFRAGDRKPRKSRVPSDILRCDIFTKSLGPKP